VVLRRGGMSAKTAVLSLRLYSYSERLLITRRSELDNEDENDNEHDRKIRRTHRATLGVSSSLSSPDRRMIKNRSLSTDGT
jgi:hypothetical protein